MGQTTSTPPPTEFIYNIRFTHVDNFTEITRQTTTFEDWHQFEQFMLQSEVPLVREPLAEVRKFVQPELDAFKKDVDAHYGEERRYKPLSYDWALNTHAYVKKMEKPPRIIYHQIQINDEDLKKAESWTMCKMNVAKALNAQLDIMYNHLSHRDRLDLLIKVNVSKTVEKDMDTVGMNVYFTPKEVIATASQTCS